jgi:two-component system response regulator YesN
MDQRVQQVISFIKHNFRYRLSLEEMARRVGLTPWDLYRLFKSATGLSPGQYLAARRMEEAKLLLTATFLNTREIMSRVGVDDENQFNRDFKSAYGLLPAQYRLHCLAANSADESTVIARS